jgi:dCMP deaminase
VRTDREQLKENFFEQTVRALSLLGTCKRAKVGCLIVKDQRIISTGYNGSPPGQAHCLEVGCEMLDGHCVRTVHAEANAIAFAARYGIATNGATLYVYGWKGGICPTCRKLAESAGITQFVAVPLEE